MDSQESMHLFNIEKNRLLDHLLDNFLQQFVLILECDMESCSQNIFKIRNVSFIF